ncbi:MAG: lipopolysaccharide heptosyltransferase II [bacterium]
MPVSPESVSSNTPHGTGSARIVVVSLSWLGDCIMAMPALSRFRERLKGSHIAVLAKPAVAPLWSLFPGVDEVMTLKTGFSGMRTTVRAVQQGGFDFAYVLPKSFRSAWIPYCARIPGRRGMAGHGRDWMLSEMAYLSESALAGHQSCEIADILNISHNELAQPPFLKVPEQAREYARRRLESAFEKPPCVTVAFFPGAAYGPSKRWPADRFVSVGRKLADERDCRILVLGSAGDRKECEQVVNGMGATAVNWCGQTDLVELAALLGECRVVVSNDSGGMHLAAGLGVPVVGIFGMTDPVKTAPVGTQKTLILAEGVTRSRDIPRDSPQARSAMESISVDQVYAAVSAWL